MPKQDIGPHLFVIFGATGDLTRRKLVPALYQLMQRRDLAQKSYVLGAARSDWSDDKFREAMRAALDEHADADGDAQAWCDEHFFYHSVGDDASNLKGLSQRIEEIEEEHDLPGNRVFYLSVPPSVYGPTIEALGEAGLNRSEGWTRLVVEKPFGHDLESAEELNAIVHEHFTEEQVYRIDHYLGKETVQNLLVFRFANVLFENVWNRDRIEKIEIVVEESLGVGSRAGYYDRSGALRDMIQNHLTQLFSLVAMEAPTRFEAEAIRREKIKLLEAVPPIDKENVVLGQYDAGEADGERIPAYHDEEGVDDDSQTPTFVQLTLEVANWRWQGVPFVLRTGKALPERLTQIRVRFRCAPVSIFQPNGPSADAACAVSPNVLIITLQPNEGFDLGFEVKRPGEPLQLETQRLHFRYHEAFGELPEAYETLLYDVLQGDQTLFVHADEVEASWRLYTPLLEADLPLHPYPAGSRGPDAATVDGRAATLEPVLE